MAKPLSTMVWQCFDHGSTMVDHGQVISGNYGLTMVNHGQFHIQKSNDHYQVNHDQIPDADIQINTPPEDEPGQTMVNHG